jgi:hypothetical protein
MMSLNTAVLLADFPATGMLKPQSDQHSPSVFCSSAGSQALSCRVPREADPEEPEACQLEVGDDVLHDHGVGGPPLACMWSVGSGRRQPSRAGHKRFLDADPREDDDARSA